MTDTSSETISAIVSCLLTLNPYRVVLFGSHATGTQDADSDVDLLVILDSDAVSQSYEERMEKRLRVRDTVREINRRVPIDLVVYTRGEYEILQRDGGSFLNEVESTGKTLYEKAS